MLYKRSITLMLLRGKVFCLDSLSLFLMSRVLFAKARQLPKYQLVEVRKRRGKL